MVASASVAAPLSIPLARQLTWWSLVFPVILVYALVVHSVPLLNWIHVLTGVLWTGADLFLGFIVGPIMRRLDPAQRAAVVTYLVPKTMLYFPAVSLTTGTAGWYLAAWFGWITPGNAEYPWVIAALILVSLMSIQGLLIILPNSVRVWLELRKPEPDRELAIRLNRRNIRLAGLQGVMQVLIIVVMSHFVVGS